MNKMYICDHCVETDLDSPCVIISEYMPVLCPYSVKGGSKWKPYVKQSNVLEQIYDIVEGCNE